MKLKAKKDIDYSKYGFVKGNNDWFYYITDEPKIRLIIHIDSSNNDVFLLVDNANTTQYEIIEAIDKAQYDADEYDEPIDMEEIVYNEFDKHIWFDEIYQIPKVVFDLYSEGVFYYE